MNMTLEKVINLVGIGNTVNAKFYDIDGAEIIDIFEDLPFYIRQQVKVKKIIFNNNKIEIVLDI